mmetsp:Transcript_342/g.332  ORF Transcript_342/g.332 Transcript_342/m.332 type:complete len:780 (-) Transcript_342:78-2417(-)
MKQIFLLHFLYSLAICIFSVSSYSTNRLIKNLENYLNKSFSTNNSPSSKTSYLRKLENRYGQGAHNHDRDEAPEEGPEWDEPPEPEYLYYAQPEDGFYYEPVCDFSDPHVFERPECKQFKPTRRPTHKPSTLEPTEYPTGSPTFEPRIDFADAQVSILMASDGYRDAHFGHAVSVYYHTAAVGAYAEGSGGSAYVFQLENTKGGSGLRWNSVGNVQTGDDTDDYFAYAVALNNDTLYVGAYKSDLASNSAGAVYVFNDDGSGLQYKQTDLLTSFTPSSNEFFGFALSSDGDFVLVGAYGNNDKGTDAGIVYAFQKSTSSTSYSNFARLYASDASDYDAFGSAVDFSGNDAVIGAHGDETRGTASGSAYVFSFNLGSRAWTEEAKLIGSEVSAHDYFGYSVAIHDGLVLVGAYHGDGKVESSGIVYVFMKSSLKSGNSQLTGWYEVSTLYPMDGTSSSYFGYSVSLHNNMAIIGAPGDDTLANAAGSAYVYEAGFHHWQMSFKLYGKGNQYDSFGCAVSIFGRIALAGSLLGDGVTTDSGSAFMFTPKNEYSVKKKMKQKETLESRLQSRFMELERDARKASTLELVSAIGFLGVVVVLFYILIFWIRGSKQSLNHVTIMPIQTVRRPDDSVVKTPSSKPKKPKASKKASRHGFQEIPIDSSHSGNSMDDSSAKLLKSPSTAGTALKSGLQSLFSFNRAHPATPTEDGMQRPSQSPPTRQITPSRRTGSKDRDIYREDDEEDDNDMLEGQMSLNKDGLFDAKDNHKKKKKNLKIVELAKL